MTVISKQEADAWDRVLDAAAELADLIETSGIAIDEVVLEELTIFLARNGAAVRSLFRHLKRTWPDVGERDDVLGDSPQREKGG